MFVNVTSETCQLFALQFRHVIALDQGLTQGDLVRVDAVSQFTARGKISFVLRQVNFLSISTVVKLWVRLQGSV